MKLITKFTLSTSLLTIVIILAVNVVLFVYQKRALIEEINQNHIVMTNGLAEVAKESLVLRNDLLLLNYLKRVQKNKGVLYAMMTDMDGEVIAHNDVQFLGKSALDSIGKKAREAEGFSTQSYVSSPGEKVYELDQAVYMDSRKMGTIRIGLSQDAINSSIEETLAGIRRRLFSIGIMALILGIAGSFVLSYSITRPLKKLAQGAVLLGSGKLEHRLEVSGRDEISDLSREFNAMAGKLEELDQLKDDFVSSVSHELRSPLTAINGYADHLQTEYSGPLNEEQKEFIGIIKKNAARLGKFVDDVLNVAKIEAGQIDIEFKPVEMTPVINEIVTLFKPVADKKGISLEYSVEKGMPQAYADHDKILQVMTNIISNALKFTPENGRIIVAAKNIPSDKFLEVSITDTGIGIPADQLEKVFDRFHQVKGVREKITGEKGTGLGLAIVKGIVESHGGKIWVKSPVMELEGEKRGTAFIFTVPKCA
jgi:signal transduction histidine kinase